MREEKEYGERSKGLNDGDILNALGYIGTGCTDDKQILTFLQKEVEMLLESDTNVYDKKSEITKLRIETMTTKIKGITDKFMECETICDQINDQLDLFDLK